MIEKLVRTSEEHRSDITICNNWDVYVDKEVNASDTGIDILVYEGLQIKQYIDMFMLKSNSEYKPYFSMGMPWATLYSADVIINNSIRFVEGLQYKEDVIFNLYVTQFSNKVVRINEPLYYHNRCNKKSLTTSELKKGMVPQIKRDLVERLDFAEKYYSEDEIFKRGLDQHIVRSFVRNLSPAVARDYKLIVAWKTIKELYNERYIKEAFKNIDFSAFSTVEKIIVIMVKARMSWLYVAALKAVVK